MPAVPIVSARPSWWGIAKAEQVLSRLWPKRPQPASPSLDVGWMGWGEVGRGCAKGGRHSNQTRMIHIGRSFPSVDGLGDKSELRWRMPPRRCETDRFNCGMRYASGLREDPD